MKKEKIKKIRKYALAGLSGVLLVLSFPEFNLSQLSWFALVPLLVAIYGSDWRESLWLGLVAGIIYFGGIMNWIMVLIPYSTIFWVTLGYVVLTLYLSCYVFLFAVSVNFVSQWKRPDIQPLAYSFLTAVTWTGLEVLRGYVATGLPWASLGYTQWRNVPLIQISSITGMYGVTFLIAMINGMIAGFLIDIRRWRSSLKAVLVPLGIIAVCFAYGWVSLSSSFEDEKIKVSMVPGNVSQKDKMASWGDKSDWIFDKYVQATQYAADEKPDILVWPESAVPQFIFPESPELDRLKFLIPRWGAYLLMGVISYEGTYPDHKVYNSAFLLSPAGEEIDRYHKIHLVPISEYFPLKRYLPESLHDLVTGVSDFDSGSRYTIFSAPPARIGVPICFESVFPEISRRFVREGANVICIITNDAWFIGTFAAQQHFSMAPFRAIENRISIFRCANYGVSCIIDPYGRIMRKLEKNEKYLTGEVGLHVGGTFYTKHGNYLPWACLAMTLFLVAQTWWYGHSNQGGLNVIRNTLRSRRGKKQAHRSRRASLTSRTKKKK